MRHTRATCAIARRYGVVATAVVKRVPRRCPRALLAIAVENAVEGCVRETFGALTATWQAEHALDPIIRSAMAAIARDETRHAELSWSIAAWARGRLSPGERDQVDRAVRAAVHSLGEDLRVESTTDLVELAGLPRAGEARALFRSMCEHLAADAPHDS